MLAVILVSLNNMESFGQFLAVLSHLSISEIVDDDTKKMCLNTFSLCHQQSCNHDKDRASVHTLI